MPPRNVNEGGSTMTMRSPRHAQRFTAALAAVALAALAGCGSGGGNGSNGTSSRVITIALDIPTTADAYVAGAISRGAGLAVKEANAKGVTIAGTGYTVALRSYDDNNQPSQSAQNVSSAISDGAVAVLEDGLGAATSATKGAAAGVPEIDIANGTAALMDPQNRPSLFRLGIANDAAATLLGKYIAQSSTKVAIIHDDSDSGRDGADQLSQALATAGAKADPSVEVPAGAATFDSQLQSVVASGAGALAIWGGDLFVAKVVNSVHTAKLTLPVFTGPTGESPAVRATAGNAATDGLRFVSSRLTSEGDATSFPQFEQRLAAANGGPTDAGFKDAEGREVRQPNDLDFFSYDAVNLVIAALKKQNSAGPGQGLVTALAGVSVTSANGDTRGFNPQNHEGIADDDMYISVIHDMKFAPVKDEILSKTLPVEDQVLADFH
jgi:branched-chain amino acid transport system substrate-binding protein